MLKNLTLLHIRGKGGKKVPLLLTPKMVKFIDVILLNRDLFGVSNSNNYIFAKNSCDSYYRGADALRDFSLQCGAEEPSRLTSTQLRKHIATASQILNLKNQDLELLARHLGHSINVHKEFYRLPHNTLDLAKVSKLLLKFERGELKPDETLNDMNLDMEDEKEEEEEEEREEEEKDEEQEEEEFLNKNDDEEDRAKEKAENKIRKDKQFLMKEDNGLQLSDSNALDGETKSIENNASFKLGKIKKVKHIKNVSCVTKADCISNKGRLPWTKAENKVIASFFERSILREKIPNKSECDECIAKHPEIKRRTWVCVKSKVHNIITANKRCKLLK